MLFYMIDIKENEKLIRKFEEIVNNTRPDDLYLFDKKIDEDGYWEYRVDQMNDWLSGFITATIYKKDLEDFKLEWT